MNKTDVLKLFDENVATAAKALGYTPQAIYSWGDGPVPEGAILRVRNWFLETQGKVPAKWMPKPKAQ
jgi:hypothetical protein